MCHPIILRLLLPRQMTGELCPDGVAQSQEMENAGITVPGHWSNAFASSNPW